jgi:outer membrane immunogenic protein
MKKLLLSGVALMVLAIGPAVAADLRLPVKALPPPPPPIQDWSGIYVGIEGGYGWGKQDFNPAFNFFQDPPSSFIFPTIGSVNQSGGVVGVTAGVQKQWGSVVLGLGAEVDWADITGTTTATTTNSFTEGVCSGVCTLSTTPKKTITVTETESINSKVNEVAYVGPKLGWAFSPSWMVYVTGGAAWAHKEDTANESFTQTCSSAVSLGCSSSDSFVDTFGQSGGLSMFGYAVGGGLDYKWQLDPGSAVILGVEYLHYGFGNNSLVLADNQFGSGQSFGINTKESVDLVVGRVSYFFSIH